jgi:UDP-galactopyranose mutase
MPKDGYTKMFERMLDHKNIEIVLSTDYKNIIGSIQYDKMIYTGPIDYFFDYSFGKLPYRSIRFEYKNYNTSSYQETAQVNYVETSPAFTRVVEHNKLSGQKTDTTTVSFEYPNFDGEPYYPVPTETNRLLYQKIKTESEKLKNVIFTGRLAEYQYFNMDQIVASSLKKFNELSLR